MLTQLNRIGMASQPRSPIMVGLTMVFEQTGLSVNSMDNAMFTQKGRQQMDERGLILGATRSSRYYTYHSYNLFTMRNSSLCSSYLRFIYRHSTLTITGYKFWPSKWSIYAYSICSLQMARTFTRAVSISVFITVFGTAQPLHLLAYVLSEGIINGHR